MSSKGRDVLLGRRGEVLSRCGLERGLENPNLSLTGTTTTTFKFNEQCHAKSSQTCITTRWHSGSVFNYCKH